MMLEENLNTLLYMSRKEMDTLYLKNIDMCSRGVMILLNYGTFLSDRKYKYCALYALMVEYFFS